MNHIRDARPLRVVHVIGDLELGGAETLLFRLATHSVRGIEQEVICLGGRGWYSERLEALGLIVHHLGVHSSIAAAGGLRLLKRLIRERADVVQSWMYFANVLAAIAGRSSGVPVVWGIHNASFESVGLGSRLCAFGGGIWARHLARHVINCSRHSSAMHAKLGYSAVPNCVIANGYDADAFYPDEAARARMRRSLGIREDKFVVGAIARWHPDKDIPNLLAAVRQAAEQGVPLHCLLIGGGLEAANRDLADEIRKAGCEQIVTALGSRDDVPELARALDLHVLPSRSEAFPNVVAETMLSGVPNVVTEVGDATEIVGDTGWSVAPGDPAKLASAIVEAWNERSHKPRQWRERQASARARIAERFTFESMVEAYAAVWREVAADA